MAIETKCKRCGEIFSSNDLGKICPKCKKEEIEAFYIVKEYLYSHPKATVAEVHVNTGVSLGDIDKMIEEGRIERILNS